MICYDPAIVQGIPTARLQLSSNTMLFSRDRLGIFPLLLPFYFQFEFLFLSFVVRLVLGAFWRPSNGRSLNISFVESPYEELSQIFAKISYEPCNKD